MSALMECALCVAGDKPVKMKRQYVHFDRRARRLTVCKQEGIKPMSDEDKRVTDPSSNR